MKFCKESGRTSRSPIVNLLTRSFFLAHLAIGIAAAQGPNSISVGHGAIRIREGKGAGEVTAIAPNILRIYFAPEGVKREITPVLDPKSKLLGRSIGKDHMGTIATPVFSFAESNGKIHVTDSSGELLTIDVASLVQGKILVSHPSADHLYGMRGIPIDWKKYDTSIFRDSGAHVAAAEQGDGGAPFAFTSKFGIFVDSIDGDFSNENGDLSFSKGSRKDVEFFIFVGPPKESVSALAKLSGMPPLPPKWTLGFMNSQWGMDQKELKSLIEGYRSRQIPLDAFILDFDYKAWGEDNYGEFRWNSTSNPGAVGGAKFPDGASGKLGQDLAAQGVKLVGIMKPRVLVTNLQKQPTDAAKEGTAHNWFLPGQKPYPEYFSGRLANDIDFTTQGARDWFWSHSKGLFQTGIAGWWNDEADDGFNSLGFFNMQRALYDGQRSISNQRAWSINRNYYLGSQRYAFGEWSGDINTGFDKMKIQTARMIAALNIGEAHWSMDTGGFNGHPSDENYARWMEFAALVPIMRVHGTFGEKRQPWRYGPVAEAAAKGAIELRSQLQPTLYDLEHKANTEGLGIVRPMFWEFPDDPACVGLTDQWMIGTSLLAAPVLDQGAEKRSLYLPAGKWYSWKDDHFWDGGKTIDFQVDPQTWADIPLFVREGSIVATQPITQYVGEKPIREINLDIWPDANGNASGEFYDDDGQTYNYEKGSSRLQFFTLTANGLEFSKPTGNFNSQVATYRVRIHGRNLQKAHFGSTDLKMGPKQDEFVTPAWKPGHVSIE